MPRQLSTLQLDGLLSSCDAAITKDSNLKLSELLRPYPNYRAYSQSIAHSISSMKVVCAALCLALYLSATCVTCRPLETSGEIIAPLSKALALANSGATGFDVPHAHFATVKSHAYRIRIVRRPFATHVNAWTICYLNLQAKRFEIELAASYALYVRINIMKRTPFLLYICAG